MASLSDDETILRLDGNTFKAADSTDGRCTGHPRCEFAVGFGCKLLARAGSNWCQTENRQDARSIVWVKLST